MVLSSAAVLAAGTPMVHGAAQDLTRSQRLVEDAELGRRAMSLAHTLADERGSMTTAVATGTSEAPAAVLDGAEPARVDRRAAELRDQLPAQVRELLDSLTDTRQAARTGQAGAVETYHAYTAVIEALDSITRSVSRSRPERAAGPVSDALPDLARAVDASAATRALLTAALSLEGAAGGPAEQPQDPLTGTPDGSASGAEGGAEGGTGGDPAAEERRRVQEQELTGLAQRTHAREGAALADFNSTAGTAGQESYQRTVTGPAVTAAEERLSLLTAQPSLDEAARQTDPDELAATLAARTEMQRGVLSALAVEQIRDLRQLRQDDLNALQLRVGLLGAALLLALGIGVYTARTLTHPLAVVRRGARRVAAAPETEEPVRYTGRNDEFAAVVAAVNELHAETLRLRAEALEAEAPAGAPVGAPVAAVGGPAGEPAGESAAESAAESVRPLGHHAERMRQLAEEQLTVIEGLEEHETDPDRLATLFALDHLAARVRRHSESLLLLSGAEPGGPLPGPAGLAELALGAVSETARYELVEVAQPLPAVRIAQPAARDLCHLLAELLDNATAATWAEGGGAAAAQPGGRVRLAGEPREGGLLLTIRDDGPGLSAERLARLNGLLAGEERPGAEDDPAGMGLHTVARLADRHQLVVRLVTRPEGGVLAGVQIPRAALVLPTEPGPVVGPGPVGEPGETASAAEAGAGPAAPAAAGEVAEPVEPAGPAGAEEPPTTGSGLPLRAPAGEPGPPAPVTVDAEELRRRLGGFQRGARQGHRDGEAAGPPAREEMQQ